MIYQVEMLLFAIAGKKGCPRTPSFFHTDMLYVESLRFFYVLFGISWTHLLCGSSFRLDFFPCLVYGWLISISCIDVFSAEACTFLPGNPGPRKIESVSSHLALTCCDARFMLWKLLCMIYIKNSNLKVTRCNPKSKYRHILLGAVSLHQPAGLLWLYMDFLTPGENLSDCWGLYLY